MEGTATYVLIFGGLGVSLALPSGICALSSLPNPVIATVNLPQVYLPKRATVTPQMRGYDQ